MSDRDAGDGRASDAQRCGKIPGGASAGPAGPAGPGGSKRRFPAGGRATSTAGGRESMRDGEKESGDIREASLAGTARS